MTQRSVANLFGVVREKVVGQRRAGEIDHAVVVAFASRERTLLGGLRSGEHENVVGGELLRGDDIGLPVLMQPE